MKTQLKKNNPIDAVITWVDLSDLTHQKAIEAFSSEKNDSVKFKTTSVEEIKYTVHSILKYAPFIRNIFIVSDKQTPRFLKTTNNSSYSKVKMVDHKTIFKEDASVLPTFNSRSIETKLYEIPGLSEHFVYFNDDIQLLRKTTETDFFIDGKPVLRGKWKKFKEHIFYKKFSFKKKTKRPGHVLSQEKSAKILGFKKLFKFHHTPHPMRVSTLKFFFLNNRELELNNIKHKFRSNQQFLTQGIANHLELKNKTCSVIQDYQLIHFRRFTKPILWLNFKLNYLSNRKNKLFLNLQDLNLCPKSKLAFILKWLEKKYRL